MCTVGEKEAKTQKRAAEFFLNTLDYAYLGFWKHREGNSNVEEAHLTDWLKRQGHSQKIIEVFGPYIHTYKYDEAVRDGVVLDLRYEARDIDQDITSQAKIDQWFEIKTSGLSDLARAQLKQRWGTMRKVLSAQDRLAKIVADVLMDMETRDRLKRQHANVEGVPLCSPSRVAAVAFTPQPSARHGLGPIQPATEALLPSVAADRPLIRQAAKP